MDVNSSAAFTGIGNIDLLRLPVALYLEGTHTHDRESSVFSSAFHPDIPFVHPPLLRKLRTSLTPSRQGRGLVLRFLLISPPLAGGD